MLLIRIPRSALGPHRVELEDYRFWYRAGNHKDKLDVDQLRQAFLAGPEYAQRARAFRAERLARIVADVAPVKLVRGDTLAVHVLHRDVFGDTRISMDRLRKLDQWLLPPGAQAIRGFRPNLEGLAAYGGQDRSLAAAYTQCGRDGSFEAVRTQIVLESEQHGRLVRVDRIETLMRDAVISAFGIMRALKLPGPFVIFVSLTGVASARYVSQVDSTDAAEDTAAPGFDRDVVALAELTVHEIPEDDGQVTLVLAPLRDELANAAGWWRSPHR